MVESETSKYIVPLTSLRLKTTLLSTQAHKTTTTKQHNKQQETTTNNQKQQQTMAIVDSHTLLFVESEKKKH